MKTERIDTEALKQAHPVADVIEQYVPLKHSGRTLVGRCPFHDDGGRPNLTVFPATESWYCFRCNVGGDVITFVEKIAKVSFLDAVEMIGGGRFSRAEFTPRRWQKAAQATPPISNYQPVLQATAEAYYFALLNNPDAVAYLRKRQISLPTAHRHMVGLCEGDRLESYLRYQRLPVSKAAELGLLRGTREFFTGRLTIAEVTPTGKVLHITGRAFAEPERKPKYLSTPGVVKPLYGWERARNSKQMPILTESVTDFLTLSEWGYLPLSSLGTGLKDEHVALLRALPRVTAVPHNDEAGWEAVRKWKEVLPGLVVVALPERVKDVNELAQRERGKAQVMFAELLEKVNRSC